MAGRLVEVHWLGRVPYEDALATQQRLVEDRRSGLIPDQLLLLEHPPVITLGVNARVSREHIVVPPERLQREGVTVHETGRGGDVTYHGPGQLVGYPILDLRPDRCDVHRYVRDLEESLIRTARVFGVAAARVPGFTGVWVGQAKLAAIGVRISRWITSHGFAFNIRPALEHFGLIVPCGLHGRDVTSLEVLLGRAPDEEAVRTALTDHFCSVFDREPVTCAQGPASR